MIINLKNKTSLLTTIIAIVCLSFGCVSKTANRIEVDFVQVNTVETPTIETEYEIYLLAIGTDKKRFVVSQQTKSESLSIDFERSKYVLNRLLEKFPELQSDTLDNYEERNIKSVTIGENFPTKKQYAVVSETELEKLTWADPFIDRFRKKYSDANGYYSLSRVGFSEDGRQALLYTYLYCGGLCASGDFYLLSSKSGEWMIQNKFTVWVS